MQDAIDHGDILLEENEPYVQMYAVPLLDAGRLKPSVYAAAFARRLSAKLGAVDAMARILFLAKATGWILTSYVPVHNEIFGKGWIGVLRRRMPLPGFFVPIDFEECGWALAELNSELDAIAAQISAHEGTHDLMEPLQRYVNALGKTLSFLGIICAGMVQRAQDPPAYSETQYRADFDRYEDSVAEYRRVGEMVNAELRILQS